MMSHPIPGGPMDPLGASGPLPPGPAGFGPDQRMMAPGNVQQNSSAVAPPLDVSDLLSKLVQQGLIGGSTSSANKDNSGSNGNDGKKENNNKPGTFP